MSTTFEKSLFLLPFGFSFIAVCAVETCCGGCLGSWLFILLEECGLLGSLETWVPVLLGWMLWAA